LGYFVYKELYAFLLSYFSCCKQFANSLKIDPLTITRYSYVKEYFEWAMGALITGTKQNETKLDAPVAHGLAGIKAGDDLPKTYFSSNYMVRVLTFYIKLPITIRYMLQNATDWW